MDFTELFKLVNLLKDHHIPFNLRELYDGYQIVGAIGHWDVVIHSGSYGHTYGLLEIMADGVSDITDDGDEVIGWLTADQVFAILQDLSFIPKGIW